MEYKYKDWLIQYMQYIIPTLKQSKGIMNILWFDFMKSPPTFINLIVFFTLSFDEKATIIEKTAIPINTIPNIR